MYTALVVAQVLIAISLIGLILIQHGKGADAGAAFGSGASGTVFGARGASNFLTKGTAWLAVAFFGVSLALAYLVSHQSGPESVVDTMGVEQQQAAEPVVPDSAAPPVTEAEPEDASPVLPE
ncbi:MAG: preprotein translocase subunit SecG [Panacagrimonas sp.]